MAVSQVILALHKGYEREYYLKHEDGIPRHWGGVKPKNREEVYKKALEQGKTWQEITGFDKMPKNRRAFSSGVKAPKQSEGRGTCPRPAVFPSVSRFDTYPPASAG